MRSKSHRKGKALEINVLSGSLFFNITEPLADDETLDIRTSSMLVGIRGTCGWVEVPGLEQMNVYLLEGKVECSNGDETAFVSAGEMVAMRADGGIKVSAFSAGAVPAFVQAELEEMQEAQGTEGSQETQGTQENDGPAAAIRNLFGTELSGPEHDVFWYRDHPGYTVEQVYDSDGEFICSLENTYDEQGLLLYTDGYDQHLVYLYDDQGRLTGIQNYYDRQMWAECYVTEDTAQRRILQHSGEESFICELYDETGRLVGEENYRSEGDLGQYIEYEYDDAGRLVKNTHFYLETDGAVTSSHYSIYEYGQ